MKLICRALLLLTLILFASKSFAQIGVTSYSLTVLGINTSQESRISGEIKTFLAPPIEDFRMELDVFLNFKPRKFHRFSVGIGANGNPIGDGDILYALTFPVQLEVYPIPDFRQISILYELTPLIGIESEFPLRHLFGIRYSFGKHPKNKDNLEE